MLLSEGVRSSTRDILKNIRSLLMLVLAPLAAMIVQMAISRTREYAADNLGARISGRPMHWLRRSSKSRAQRKPCQTTLRNPHPATAPLSIVNPLSGRGMDNRSPPIHRPRIASPRSIDCRMKWVSVALVHRGRLPQAPGPALGPALSGVRPGCGVWSRKSSAKSSSNTSKFPPPCTSSVLRRTTACSGPGSLNRFSASLSGVLPGVRLPCGWAAG